jgi:hypothetical protein
MKEKKGLFQLGMLALALSFGLAGISCVSVSDAGRYDYASPEEEDAVILLGQGGSIYVSAFDDQTVSWKSSTDLGFLINQFRIRIPAGTHTLAGGQENSSRPGELLFTTSTRYNFMAGKSYTVDIVNRNFRIVESADAL